jgi:hypothetical protein
MGFWPVNEMTELVSGMPAPQFGDESSSIARIRAGPRFMRFREMFSRDPYDIFAYPRLKTTALDQSHGFNWIYEYRIRRKH